MKLRVMFTIVSVVAILYGLGALLVPTAMMQLYGFGTDPATVVVGRFFGVEMLAVGLIDWFVRDFTGASALPIIRGNLVADAVGVIVSIVAVLDGTMNAMGWSAVAIYLLFTLGFAYFQISGAPATGQQARAA